MTIEREDAIARARALALERGWPWREPVRVHREFAFVFFGRMRWVVVTNAENRGGTFGSSWTRRTERSSPPDTRLDEDELRQPAAVTGR